MPKESLFSALIRYNRRDMRTLTKAKLTDNIVETIGLSHHDAKALVEFFLRI